MKVLLLVCLLLTEVASDTNPVRRRNLLPVDTQDERAAILQEDSSSWGRSLQEDMSMSMSSQGMWKVIVMLTNEWSALHS